jgi:outer membrane receptor protein involved in Fe transport
MRITQLKIRSSIATIAVCLMAPSLAQAQTAPTGPAPAQPPPAQSPSGTKPEEIVVTGARSDVVATADRVSFNITNDLNVQTGTVADALRAVPGVEVDLQGQVSLRGDPGVTILIDGRPSALLRGDSRGEALLSMPANQLERVEVITNPSAAMSPEGSGGVINLVTRQARRNTRSLTVRPTIGLEGRGGISFNGSHSGNGLTVTGDLGYRRFAGDAEATQLRSRLDPVSGSFVSSRLDADIENVFSSRNARGAVEYDVDKKNRVSTELSYRDGSGEVERSDELVSENAGLSYQRESEIDLSQRGMSGRASWRRTLPGKEHEVLADIEVERGRMKREVEAVTDFASAPQAFERIRNEGQRRDNTLKLDYKKQLGEDSSLNLGYHGSLSESDFDSAGSRGASLNALLSVPGLTNSFEYDQLIHAFFGTYRFRVGKLETQAGLRLEQVETTIDQITDNVRFDNDYFRVYPTLHLGYELPDNQRLRGSYSRRIQRPSPQDLNPYTFYIDPRNLRRGNPFLRPEVTDSFELAWHLRKGGAFYSLTGFYRRAGGGVTDIISDFGDGIFLTTRANLATAERIGAELVANGRLSKTLSYNASGTLLWNEIDPRLGGASTPRSGTTGSARTNLNWQPTPKDFFQLNAMFNGKQLLPQGYRESFGMLNLGYRRKVNDKLSLLLTAQNVLDSAKQVVVFDTPTIRDRFEQRGPAQILMFGLTYTIGGQTGRQRQEPAFDFSQDPGAGAQ